MFGKNPRIGPLELRKHLLVAESEINRALLAEDAAVLKAEVRAVTDRARSFTSIVSSVATIVMGLSAFRRAKPADAGSKPSWFQTILKYAPQILSFWMTFRSTGRDRPGE